MRSIVVIPTYNEIDNIKNIIKAVLEAAPEVNILIVDDNSPDGTAVAVEEMGQQDERIHLLKRAGKMGLGTAYCDGFSYCLEKKFDENYDLVIGSRYISGVNVVNWPLRRLILSYGASIYSRIITGLKIKDTTGGFKCFRAEMLRKIDLKKIHSNGYGFQIEMNYKVWKKGGRIKEISIIFIDRRSGVSKMNRSIIWEAVFLVWKLRFTSKKYL